ncbi:MAG: GNAT family N-acetyltransferase [Dehalococcoidia bacterium]
MMRITGASGLPRALRALDAMEHVRPTEPHFYLLTVGVDPSAQGRGIASSLIRHVLDRCDREGIPSYRESSKESNIPIYEHLGYQVRAELRLPDGPSIWPMWRDPQ